MSLFSILSPLSPILKKIIRKEKIKNKIVFEKIGDNGDKLLRKPSESLYLLAFWVSPLPVFPGDNGDSGDNWEIFPKSSESPYL